MSYKNTSFMVRGKKFYPFKDVVIFDIETKKINPNKGISAENSKHVISGFYSYNDDKISYTKGAPCQKVIDDHRICVGYNIKGFDIPVLEKDLGLSFKYKILLDLLEVLRAPPSKSEKMAYIKKGKRPPTGKGRVKIIGEALQKGMIDNRFPNLKLGTVLKHGYKLFKDHPHYSKYFQEYKDEDFDYDILAKENKTPNDWKIIKEYLRKDIIGTKNLFEFLELYFRSLHENLSNKDILSLDYLHAPTGSYFYKCICYDLNLPVEYGNQQREKFPGAKVLLPTQAKYDEKDGEGYCIDWASQHPHNIWSANLATPVEKCKHQVEGSCPNPYSGDGKIFKLKGIYCGCEMGEIEKWLRMMYFKRNYFKRKYVQPDGKHLKFKDIKVGDIVYFIDEKRNLIHKTLDKAFVDKLHEKAKEGIDPREYSVKILINSGYGVLSSPIFKSTYHPTTGPDTTLMSQQSTMYMVRWMEKGGYIVTYGDTDSCYIMDPYKDKNKMKAWMAQGVQHIRDALPFSDTTYNMDIDAEFSHIFFIKDEKKNIYKKKNYIYILNSGKIKLMGIPLLKSNAPKLAKQIYLQHLEPEIKRTKKIKFDRAYIKQLIEFEIEKDKSILVTQIRVHPYKSYATEGAIQAQISKNYFEGKEGIFKGIKHLRKDIGVGKGVRYCSYDESSKLHIADLDLATVWKTLDPFLIKETNANLFAFSE